MTVAKTNRKILAAHERAAAEAEELGQAVCGDQAAFSALLPDLVAGKAGRLLPFGKGLALASVDRRYVWDQLAQAVARTQEGARNIGALAGFLFGLSHVDVQLCEALLEEALAHEVLGAWFPALQTSVNISAAGADRLKRAVRLGKAPVGSFRHLGLGRSSDAISGVDLRTIVLSLANQENGYGVATDILSMRFHSDKDQNSGYPSELIDAGRRLLSSPVFDNRDNMDDYRLCTIAKVCLCGPEGSASAQLLCEQIWRGITDYTFRSYCYPKLLRCIFRLQSRVALDVFWGGAEQTDSSDLDIDAFVSPTNRRNNPLDGVPVEELLGWCDENPAERYPALSCAVSYFTAPNDGGVEWTYPALEMLKRSPDPLAVLQTFVGRFFPTSWSGSRAAIIESRLTLLDQISELKNPTLAEYVARIRPQLEADIVRTREWEDECDSTRDERFE